MKFCTFQICFVIKNSLNKKNREKREKRKKGWKREELGVIFGLLANEPTTVVICVLLVNEILVAIFVLLSELLWVTFVLSNVSYQNS